MAKSKKKKKSGNGIYIIGALALTGIAVMAMGGNKSRTLEEAVAILAQGNPSRTLAWAKTFNNDPYIIAWASGIADGAGKTYFTVNGINYSIYDGKHVINV